MGDKNRELKVQWRMKMGLRRGEANSYEILS